MKKSANDPNLSSVADFETRSAAAPCWQTPARPGPAPPNFAIDPCSPDESSPDESSPDESSPDESSPDESSPDEIDQWLTRLALANLPRQFTDDKKWGLQVEKRRGFQVVNPQGKLDIRSKKERVNHGNWRKYSASLRNPEEEFRIQLRNIRELDEGGIGLEVHCKGHLDFVAQQANWKNGIRLLNLTATGHTEVEIQIELEIRTEFVGNGLLPDMILRPSARQARLFVHDFRVDRIGKIGGEPAQQIGREAYKQLNKKLPEQEQKIVAKINQEFAKKENGYRFSWSDNRESELNEVFIRLLGAHRK